MSVNCNWRIFLILLFSETYLAQCWVVGIVQRVVERCLTTCSWWLLSDEMDHGQVCINCHISVISMYYASILHWCWSVYGCVITFLASSSSIFCTNNSTKCMKPKLFFIHYITHSICFCYICTYLVNINITFWSFDYAAFW